MKRAFEIKEGGVTERRTYKGRKVKAEEKRKKGHEDTGTQRELGQDQPASLMLL